MLDSRVLLGLPVNYEAGTLLACLAQEGIEAAIALFSSAPIVPTASRAWGHCLVVQPEAAPTAAAEVVVAFRSALEIGTQLTICTPERTTQDRQGLLECGASDVVSPRSWAPEHVAERLLSVVLENHMIAPSMDGSLHGGTTVMRRLYAEIAEVAPFPDPVLITGETGSGKELIARELHRRSGRQGDLLAVNCAELSPQLVESELFGHVRGAFTGADRPRDGLLVAAGEGTLFLDEIGEASPAVQTKLLRAIEQQEVRPLGGNRKEPVRARFVLGTNRDLTREMERGSFRTDLYHRIAGVTLRAPPLRERRADIPLLARLFLEEVNSADGGNRSFALGALDRLMSHAWPGNVRELRATVRRAAMSCAASGGAVRIAALRDAARDLAKPSSHTIPFDPMTDSWPELEERAKAIYLKGLLGAVGGDKPQAIARSKIGRSQFYAHMKALKIGED